MSDAAAPAKRPVISKERMYQTILSPLITEKATALSEQNQVVFKVRRGKDLVELRGVPKATTVENEFLVVRSVPAGTEIPVQDPGTLYGPSLNYTTIVNQDFQTVRGFQFVLRRGVSNYWGADVNYGYMQVRTNASAPDLEFQRTTEEGDIPARQEIRSDADQRQTLSAVLRLAVGERTPGFRFGNVLKNSGMTVTGRVISGFPYTPTFTFSGSTNDRLLRNSGTGPTAFFVNLEARKAINVANLRYQTFVRVTNLFDQKNCAQVFATTGNCDGGASPQARLAAGNFTGEGELSTFFDRPQYLYDRRFVNAGVRVDF